MQNGLQFLGLGPVLFELFSQRLSNLSSHDYSLFDVFYVYINYRVLCIYK